MGFSSVSALAKLDTGPRSTVIFDFPVGVPMRLLSTAMSFSSGSSAAWWALFQRGYLEPDKRVSLLGGVLRMGLVDGKVAIVTGAGHGVGRGEALLLAREGAKGVGNDLGGSVGGEGADKRPAEEGAEGIRSAGGEARAKYDDVAGRDGGKKPIQ